MRANRIEYLFSVNRHTPPTMAVHSSEEFTIDVRGAFDDIEDITAIPTPFTPACDGHPLAPITGPIVVRDAKPGDVVSINLIELIPFGIGKSAILRDFGVLRREFPEPMALSSPVRDGRAWFGDRNGRADLMVSGDGDLLALNPFREIPIVTPAMFAQGAAHV